ncbi:hypothetical protein B0H14DRAFT_3090128 [Mycena olivaceomarginata]|nr:hypothetical protein B0H14DRAFT_3090128 [Mycena olivaceomarginata]
MFVNPTVKVYNVLPPTRDELSEVLAFVLGPTKPTEEEFRRTPMLVRRQRDQNALDWLKLNHWRTSKVAEQEDQRTFAVHGLTGEQYNTAKIDTLKTKALDHLPNGGQKLGVGHAAEPESTYNNVQLYPQMFPWLVPYGLGGIGHPTHKN